MTAQLLHAMRELDRRTNDGLEIRLLWDPNDGRVAVAVTDSKTGDDFGFEVYDRERAREAFQHPFSYAAWRGIETRPSGVDTLDELAAQRRTSDDTLTVVDRGEAVRVVLSGSDYQGTELIRYAYSVPARR